MKTSQKSSVKLKTMIPVVYHTILPRKHVAAIIDNANLDEAVCIIAPYGCGKTLTVVSWLHEHARNAAWLTLDETDDSDRVFFTDISKAIRHLIGLNGDLDTIQADPIYSENLKALFWETIETAETKNCDKILVLDGLHFVHDPLLLRSVKELVTALLGRWRIIIISRAELPSVFNDLMLKRHICLIPLKELSYSIEETAEFFTMNGCNIPRQEMIQIHEQTEGWPASLNVIYTLSRGGAVVYDEAAREYIADFFETEIWAGLDEKIKSFLLKTSILDKLTPAACNAVTDLGATLPILRWLFVNGMFIFKMSDTTSYRYHRVFRDFLQRKLNASEVQLTELYKKIAWWLFERDAFEQAFPYFFKAGDLYGLSRVFRMINSAEMGLENYLELVGCMVTLDVDDLREYPLIVAKIALVHYALGNITEMQRLYSIFLEWIEPGTLPIPPEEYAECMWEAGWLSYLNPAEPLLNNKHEEWFNYLEYDPHLQALHQIRAAVYRFPSMLRGIRDYCPVIHMLDEYLQQNKDTGYSTIGNAVSLWRLDIVRAEYAYELENFALAEELIRDVITEVEARQITDLYFVCIALLVKLIRVAHNPKEVGVMTARLENMIVKNGHTFLLPRFHAFELRNRLAEGITGQTESFEKENRDYIEKPYFYLLYRHMTLVRAYLSTGDYNEANMLLGNLERLCYRYNRVMDWIEVNILKSVADFRLGNEERARRHIMDALQEARKYGFIRIFSDDAKDLWPIWALLDKAEKDDYAQMIIISCKKTLARAGIKIHRKNRTQSELTKTELKILKTLDTGMSYHELALDNGIKVSTVKTHIRSIYSKLDVDNRTSAVIAARSKGLLN